MTVVSGCWDTTKESATGTAASVLTSTLSDSCAALEQLAALDSRRPVSLQPMMAWHQKQSMMDHLAVIQEVTDALSREDWSSIATASARIESSEEMARSCEHMGARADGFTALALDFHRRADGIGEAALRKDRVGVLTATADTLAACTGCHSQFRQELVSAESWSER